MSDDLLGFESLDALVAEGVRHAKAELAKKAKGKERRDPTAPIVPSEKYSNPENWIAARKIALIHEGTQTLLGAFREMLHKTEEGCRRLVREDSAALIDAQEYVNGTWGWVQPAVDPSAHAPAVIIHRIETAIMLTDPAVHAYTTVLVHKQGAGILRVELLLTTLFADAGRNFLEIASGTNLLPVLDRATKIGLHNLTQEAA